ncbi:MAG: hypothetical protein PHW04_17025 [Candidatus Wallbacteria bacterium]|nr:hypothetical protein [Candidatus Wallbacteria bacterium]
MKNLLLLTLILSASLVFANAKLNKAVIDTLDPLIAKGFALDEAVLALKPVDPSVEQEKDNFLGDFFSYLKMMEIKYPNALSVTKKKELLARLLDISETFSQAEKLGSQANVQQTYNLIRDKVGYVTDTILMSKDK